jgi:hypothetical protein
MVLGFAMLAASVSTCMFLLLIFASALASPPQTLAGL